MSEQRPGAVRWVPPGADVPTLRRAAPACRGCELWQDATQVVFSAGSTQARLALVGEQPGDVEDRRGVPFVGPAGRLLQQAVREVGLEPAELYVTNAVKHFRFTQTSPGTRRLHQTPELAHLTACRPWLVAELRAVDPEVVVCLGASAAKSLLGHDFRVTRQRGQVLERRTSRGLTRFVATVHPAAVLRTPEVEREAAYRALLDDLNVAVRALGPSSRQPAE